MLNQNHRKQDLAKHKTLERSLRKVGFSLDTRARVGGFYNDQYISVTSGKIRMFFFSFSHLKEA